MRVFLNLHKTVDGQWTSGSGYINEDQGILCRLDDGSGVTVTHDGRVMRFDATGQPLPPSLAEPAAVFAHSLPGKLRALADYLNHPERVLPGNPFAVPAMRVGVAVALEMLALELDRSFPLHRGSSAKEGSGDE